METISTPSRNYTSRSFNIPSKSHHRNLYTPNSNPAFESIQQIHNTKILQNELQSLKEAFNKLQNEKLFIETEAIKEQELHILTINQLKTVISSLDKEKEALEDQLVSEYELSENSIMETEIERNELQELYADSKQNWEREKRTLENIIIVQKSEISELKKGKTQLESLSSKCSEKIHKMEGQIHDLKEEIEHLKALVALNAEGSIPNSFYREGTSNSIIHKSNSRLESSNSFVSDNSTTALESPRTRFPLKSSTINPVNSRIIDYLKTELSSSERQARRSRLNSSHNSSFKLPENLMMLINKPKK